MIYLKKYKIFENSEDDYDIMAKEQIFGADCFVSFSFRNLLIKDKSEILNLIKSYNSFSKKDGEWLGGPVSRRFDEYFVKKYKVILGDITNFKLNKPSKPLIGLTIKTDYGYTQTGFSIKDKKMSSIYSTPFDLNFKDEFKKDITNLKVARIIERWRLNKHDSEIISEMYNLLNSYWNKTIYELSDDLNLYLNFDWTWD